jgi:hypothetical protein
MNYAMFGIKGKGGECPPFPLKPYPPKVEFLEKGGVISPFSF